MDVVLGISVVDTYEMILDYFGSYSLNNSELFTVEELS